MKWATLALVCVACSGAPPETDVAITYHEHVRPILGERCAGCHTDGGIAPFSLESYAEALAVSEDMRSAVLERRMPPFGVDASGACNDYRSARWLSERELDIVDRWASGDRAEGDPALAPVLEPAATATLATSAVLDMDVAYAPPADRKDDYRCFLVDPGLRADAFLTAFEVVPGEPRIVHHVILFTIDDEASEAQADRLDARSEAPGYPCFGGSLLPPQSSRMIAGWAPGTGVTRYPDASGIRLLAGRRLAMQVHYNLREGALADRTRMRLELAEGVERPAEILPMADLALSVRPAENLVFTDPFQVAVPGIGAFVRGVFPHMHELGREMHARIVHADGRETCLARVPRWDFQWQEFFVLEEPLYVLSTDRIELRCGYDTRSRTEPVAWGEGTEDEMCLLGLYVTLN